MVAFQLPHAKQKYHDFLDSIGKETSPPPHGTTFCSNGDMGFPPFRNRQIANLSGGQRQKVWLAMALAQKTEILLLDEPTTYLDDMAHQLEVLQIVEKLNKEDNLSQQEVYKEAVLSN